MEIRSLCVFCGSNRGANRVYSAAAQAMARMLVRRGCRLVYGGGSVGLMGVIADTVLAEGGQVTGVIPSALATKDVIHGGLTETHVTDNMHARKAKMAELSDAFVALPGGYGTLEELFEVVTWGQLGLHNKPLGILNTGGYYDGLLEWIDAAVAESFIKPEHRKLIIAGSEPDALFEALMRHDPPAVEKWIRADET